jgi:hypothetical protein
MKKWPYMKDGLSIGGQFKEYFTISVHLKAGLIRGVTFDWNGLIRGVTFDGNDLIRGVTFAERDLIRIGLPDDIESLILISSHIGHVTNHIY